CFARLCRTLCLFFFSSRRRHTSSYGDWSSDVCSSDLYAEQGQRNLAELFDREVSLALLGIQHPERPARRNKPLLIIDVVGCRQRSEERRVGKEWRSRAARGA